MIDIKKPALRRKLLFSISHRTNPHNTIAMPYVLPKNSKYVAACTTAGGKSCQKYIAWSRMVDEPPGDVCSLVGEGWDPATILEEKILATAHRELNDLDIDFDEQQLNKVISRLCAKYIAGQSSKTLWKPDQKLPQAYRKCVLRDSAHLRTADRCGGRMETVVSSQGPSG
jgi:hypothetical protein